MTVMVDHDGDDEEEEADDDDADDASARKNGLWATAWAKTTSACFAW
jgi:hypothetical protein